MRQAIIGTTLLHTWALDRLDISDVGPDVQLSALS